VFLYTETLIWQIGCGPRGVSISEEGVLRAFYFSTASRNGVLPGVPSAADIQDCLLRAISDPVDPSVSIKRKPKIAAFLQSRTCDDATVLAVGEYAEKEWGVKVEVMESIKDELVELKKARVTEAANEKQALVSGSLPDSMAVPPRGCSSCKQPVKKQANCGACKSIIYCSTNCQKKDWPKHKELCKTFAVIMERSKKVDFDDFPFLYYNKKNETVLYDYNQVNILSYNGINLI
jgi:hypothetical protein